MARTIIVPDTIKNINDDNFLSELYYKAWDAYHNSYSPISNFKVGAAIYTSTGNFYSGTNVEESAFNQTTHAEQSCIAQMIAKEGKENIILIVTVTDAPNGEIVPPCGHCRQLLAEFADDNLRILTTNLVGDILLNTTLGTLLPYAFRLNEKVTV